MNLKYIKRFNESKNGELSFDDFKNIMFDLVDQFNFEYEFNDYSDEDKFYDCWIYMPIKEGYEIQDNIPYMNFDYLSEPIPTTDEPNDISNNFEEIFEYIDGNKEDLENLKSDIDDIIEANKKTKLVFEILKDKIIPRFNNFSNFIECGVGHNSGELRITFEINDEKD